MNKIKEFSAELHEKGIRSYGVIRYVKKLPLTERAFYAKGKNIMKLFHCLVNLEEVKAKANLAKELEGKTFGYSVKKYFEMKQKATEIAKCFNAGYSRGGVVNLYLKDKVFKEPKFKEPFATFDNRTFYKGTKYKPTHSDNFIAVTKKELELIQIIGGIPTIILEKKKIAKCIMFTGHGYKNVYQITKKEGYITSDFHAESYAQCIDYRTCQVKRLLKNREQQKNLDIFRAEQKILIEKNKHRFVGFEHSRSVGNCHDGTEMFAKRHNLNIAYGYNLNYLLMLEPNNFYLQRLLYLPN